ncbi:conserved protein of unknown function [Methylococcus capsulatus]|jgi:hypothetical protein|uniref:DUF4376 domain-containing protein n=1 Tax=Methylococcus capsulatus TaxID=414 RepID=A0AA35UXG5_METCP|nr:DUF4376 domain-containing protein [Methylococcus capsulatus]CAI8743198.1 conserved protein of unknown function [Methylococcus capsulatus]
MRYKATLPPEDFKRLMRARVNAEREARLRAGFEFQGHTYDTDPQSVANMTAVLAALGAGLPLPEGFAWRDRANIDVPMDEATFKAFTGSLLVHVNSIYVESWRKKDEIKTSGNPASIDAD